MWQRSVIAERRVGIYTPEQLAVFHFNAHHAPRACSEKRSYLASTLLRVPSPSSRGCGAPPNSRCGGFSPAYVYTVLLQLAHKCAATSQKYLPSCARVSMLYVVVCCSKIRSLLQSPTKAALARFGSSTAYGSCHVEQPLLTAERAVARYPELRLEAVSCADGLLYIICLRVVAMQLSPDTYVLSGPPRSSVTSRRRT